MRNIIIRLFINIAALWVADKLFTGIWFSDTNTLILTAIVFGILNTFIKPVLIIFTLPINILSLGLFTLIINAVILELADFWIDGFRVDGFGIAILASVFISLVSIVLHGILKEKR